MLDTSHHPLAAMLTLIATLASAALALALASAAPPLAARPLPARLAPPTQAEPQRPAWPASFLTELARHRYFKKLAFHAPLEDTGPFALFLQRQVVEGQLLRACEIHYAPWLKHLGESFERDFVVPAGLVRRPERPRTPVVLLATRGDYVNYWPSNKGRWGAFAAYGHYDRALDAPVHPQCARDTRALGYWRRYPLLRDAARGLLHDHLAPGLTEIAEDWIEDGLSSYLAFHLGATPDDLDRHRSERSYVECLCPDGRAREDWMPTHGLLAVRGDAGLTAFLREQGAQLKAGELDPKALQFEATSWLLVHFLCQADEGRRLDAFRRYLALALKGQGTLESFRATLGIDDLEQLDRELRARASELFAAREGAGASDSAEVEAGAEAALAEVASAPPSLPALQASPRGATECLAHALWCARRGALSRALEILIRARAATQARVDSSRLERASELLAQTRAARDAALAQLLASGGKLRLEVDGSKQNLPLEDLRDGRLLFGTNKAELQSLALEEIAASELLGALSQELKQAGSRWALGFALALEGDTKAARYLGEGGPQSDWIREQIQSGLSAQAQSGEAFELLAALEAGGPPLDAETAARASGLIADLCARHLSEPALQNRLESLRAWARAALREVFPAEGLASVLAAELHPLEDGRLELRYDFDDAAELGDWQQDPDYLLKEQQHYAGLNGYSARPLTRLDIADGSLSVSGWVCLRHRLDFEPPLRVELELQYSFPAVGESAGSNQQCGILDDRRGHYAMVCNPTADLEVRDTAQLFLRKGSEPEPIDPQRTLQIGIEHDGASRVRTTANGLERQSGTSGTLESGNVFVWVNSESLLLYHRITIVARPTQASLAALAEAWVEERLRALGLDS